MRETNKTLGGTTLLTADGLERPAGEAGNLTHGMTRVLVAAVKKTTHGGYGRRLDTVTVEIAAGAGEEMRAHAAALVVFRARWHRKLKITTEILRWGT